MSSTCGWGTRRHSRSLYRLEGGFAELLASASRGALDPSLVRVGAEPTACVVMASGGYPAKYETGVPIKGLRAAEQLGAKVFHAGTRFSGGRIVTAGGRVLGVTASGKGLHEALANVYRSVDVIDFTGVQYRRDIGSRGLRRLAAGASE